MTGVAKHLHSDVHGVVLAGVHAWGENVLERVICRPLVRVAARPLICHTLARLREGGVGAVSICANSDTIHLRRQLGDGRHMDISLDYYEDVMPRGPAGCARDVAAGTDCGTFLVVEGTILPKIDLEDLLCRHQRSGATLTVVVAGDRRDHREGPRGLEPAGMYVFSREGLESVPATGYQDIKESLIPRLYANGQVVHSYVVDQVSAPAVKGVASYLAVNEWAVEQLVRGEPPPGYHSRGQALVHSAAVVHSSARLVGPVWVEPGCCIGEDALVIGPTVIGAGSTIGPGAVVSRSAIWERCTIAAGVILDQSIIADDAVVDSDGPIRHQVVVPDRPAAPSLLRRLFSGRRWRSRVMMQELGSLRRREAEVTGRAPAEESRPASFSGPRVHDDSARLGVT